MNYNEETNQDTEQSIGGISPQGGILLNSVGSWCDQNGIHPLNDNNIPDLDKSMTTEYKEIEYIEFTSLMDKKDVALYRVALKEYAPEGKQCKVWVDQVWALKL
jgi:hypothetical protein